MSILREVLLELRKMFLADALLSISILVLVAFVAVLVKFAKLGPLLSGGVLLAGCLFILVFAAYRQSRS